MSEDSEILSTDRQAMAVSSLPSELAIMKMENENIVALAAARPRDHKKIKADLAAQIEAYPSFARDAIYSKPVGKDQSGRMQFARGLSIRAAEAIAEAYGYCRIRCEVTPIDDTCVKVEATFSDYQRGRIWQDAGILSRFYKSRGGQMVKHPDDRFYGLVVKAEASRRIREVILRSVPPGLRSELMEMAEQKIDDLLDDKTIQKIVGKFAGKGVDLPQLETHVGRTLKAGWTKEDRKDLLGLWNAIESGETTVAEAFGASPAATQPTGANGVNGSDLTGEAASEPDPHAAPAAKSTAAATANEMEAADFMLAIGEKLLTAESDAAFKEIGAELVKQRDWLGDERSAGMMKRYQDAYRRWQERQAPPPATTGRRARATASDI
jgi:hypothetical protein